MKNVSTNDRLTLVVHLSRNTSEQHGFHHRLYPVCIKIDRVEASKQDRVKEGFIEEGFDIFSFSIVPMNTFWHLEW